MFDPTATQELVNRAIQERDSIRAALRADSESSDLKEKISQCRQNGGWPLVGVTTQLLKELRPSYRSPPFIDLYQRACSDALAADLGAYLLPKLEAVKKTHEAFLDRAVDYFDTLTEHIETDRHPFRVPLPSDEHNRAISDLANIVGRFAEQDPTALHPTDTGADSKADSDPHAPYMPARWFETHTNVPPRRLRQAHSRGKLPQSTLLLRMIERFGTTPSPMPSIVGAMTWKAHPPCSRRLGRAFAPICDEWFPFATIPI